MITTHIGAPPDITPDPDGRPEAAATAVPATLNPGLTRRNFLHIAGLTSATAIVAGTGAFSYRVYDTAALNPNSGDAFEPWQHWRETPGLGGAVAAAVLAASPHNTQPWIFGIHADSVDVIVDRSRGTGTVDPFAREQHMGIGCAIENLVLACQARGLRPSVTLLPDGPDGPRLAEVTVTTAKAESNPLYDAIGKRRTNRGPYKAQAVSAETLNSLVDVTGLNGLSVQWIDDAAPKRALSTLLIDAAKALCADKQQSLDNFAWFRSNNDAVQRHRDGLTLGGQGFGALMLALAKLLPASSRESGDQFWVKQTETVHTKTAAAYGVITATNVDDREVQLNAGRLLQRIHLTATSRGIALQHMNQVTERIDRERSTDSAATFAPRFAELLPFAARPLLTFRVGHPVRTIGPSPRRSAEQVTR